MAVDKKTAELPQTQEVNLEIKEGGNPNMAEFEKTSKESSNRQPAINQMAHLSANHMQLSYDDTDQSSSVRISDGIIPDSVSRIVAQQENAAIKPNKEQSDTVSAMPLDATSAIHKIESSRYNNIASRRKKTKYYKGWNLFFAYSGSVQGEKVRTNDYMTLPSLSSDPTRSTKIYNWGEYMAYVTDNAQTMDPLTALNMSNMAIINSNNPQTPIYEKSKHERPLTLQLLFNRQISNHWSFTTGLSITEMKSTYESGNENTLNTPTLIYRKQRIHYLGIPLKANFHMVENNHMSIYTSGGILLDVPVSARLTTKYIYSDPNYSSFNSPDINTRIYAPCQWSLGVGLGVQYEILPHFNIFLEPSLNYYLPNRQGIETYRKDHPLDISIPVGIKICW